MKRTLWKSPSKVGKGENNSAPSPLVHVFTQPGPFLNLGKRSCESALPRERTSSGAPGRSEKCRQKRKSPWVGAISAPNRPDLLRSSVRRAQMVDMEIRDRKRGAGCGANSGP